MCGTQSRHAKKRVNPRLLCVEMRRRADIVAANSGYK